LKVFDKLIFHSMKRTEDGGCIIGGGIGDYPLGLLIKLERSGRIEWAKTYKVSEREWGNDFSYVEQTKDGGYIAIASYSLILKLDKDGNEEWRKMFDPSIVYHIASITQTDDGGYIAVGWTIANEDNDFIIKLDSKGDTEWAKLTDRDDNFRVIQQTTDGGYIAAGGMKTVFKFDSRGNMGKNCNFLKDNNPETVVPLFEVKITDITKEIKIGPEPSFRSELINLSFITKDVQVTTICDGK